MLLLIDIGNTRTKISLLRGEECVRRAVPHEESVAEALQEMLAGARPRRIAYLGTGRSEAEVTAWLRPYADVPTVRLTGATPHPTLRNLYAVPEQLGADRWVAAVGAWTLYAGKNLLLVDAGTCMTLDVVRANGEMRPHAIVAGMQMQLRALHRECPVLPALEITDAAPSIPAYASTTEEAMRIGVLESMAQYIIGVAQSPQFADPPLVLLTGGDARRLPLPSALDVRYEPHLIETGMLALLQAQSLSQSI